MLPTHAKRVLKDQQSAGPVNAVRFSNNSGQYCMTVGGDKMVKLWNPHSGQLIKTYAGHSREILSIDISSDNGRFATCGMDNAVFVWDVNSGKPYGKLHGHHQRVNCVAFNQDGNVIASGSYDATVKLWDCRQHALTSGGIHRSSSGGRHQKSSISNITTPIQTLDDAKDSVSSLQIVQHEIMCTSIDGNVRRYDLRMGRLTSECLAVPITHAVNSKDGNCILIASLDDTLRLIDRETGDILSEYKSHLNSKYKLECTISNDDAFVLCGSEDGLVYIWDLVEETVVATLKKHTRTVLSLAYHPTEPLLLTSSSDGTIVLWSPPPSDS